VTTSEQDAIFFRKKFINRFVDHVMGRQRKEKRRKIETKIKKAGEFNKNSVSSELLT